MGDRQDDRLMGRDDAQQHQSSQPRAFHFAHQQDLYNHSPGHPEHSSQSYNLVSLFNLERVHGILMLYGFR